MASSTGIRVFPTLKGYPSRRLRLDVLAGLAAGCVVIPQAMSYATVAGLPVEIGLYTCLLPMVVYAAFGGSRTLSVSTTSTIAILVSITVADGAEDAGDLLDRAFTLTFLVGVLLLAARLMRIAGLVENISPATLIGVKAGVGLTVASTQLPVLLGIPDDATGSSFVAEVDAALGHVGDVSGVTVAVSAASVLVLLVLRRVAPAFPAPLVVVVGGILLVALTDVADQGLALIDEVPSGFPGLSLPHPELVLDLLPGALAIAAMAFLETSAVARSVRRRDEPRIDSEQELLAIGLASLAGGLTQSMPPAGGFSQTAVNLRSNARSQAAGLVTAALAVAVALFLAPALSDLPRAVLGSLVLVAILGLLSPQEFRRLRAIDPVEFWVAVATALVGLFLGLLPAVGAGVVLTLLLVLRELNRPQVRVVPGSPPGVLVLHLAAGLYTGNARPTSDAVETLVDEGTHAVVLECSEVEAMTTPFVDVVRDLHENLHDVTVVLAGLPEGPRARARGSAWFSEWADSGHLFDDLGQAVSSVVTSAPEEEPR